MATLNVHENVLNELRGSEQFQQEEVQLTELLPVKQSQIRENGIFEDEGTDADATDALKILRSFTNIDGCDDTERELRSRHLPFCGRIEHVDQGKQENRKQWRVDKVRKRIDERGKNVVDNIGIEEGKEKQNRSFEVDSRMEKRTRRRVDIKTIAGRIGKPRKRRMIVDTIENIIEQENKEYNSGGGGSKSQRTTETNTFLDDRKGNCLSDYEEQMEVATYLDLDKSNHLSDEIYVFDRDSINGERRRNARLKTVGRSYNHEDHTRTTDEALLDRIVISTGGTIEEEISTLDAIPVNSRSLLEPNGRFDGSTGNRLLEGRDTDKDFNFAKDRANSSLESVPGGNVVVIVESSSLSSLSSSSCVRNENGSGAEDEQGSQQKKYCCVVCEARFKGSGGLRNHYKIVHGAGPIFKCDECGKEFPLKERLKLHVRTHTGFKPYKCPDCDKSFARGGQLVQHRRTHSQVKPYRCGLCSGTFTCAANLALHVKRHNGQKDHKCEICGRAFVRRDALKKHLECLHRDVKSFLCVICNKTFKGHLPQHMRTHARDRPHGCATCGQRFAQKSQLTVHQRTHSGQRPFRCLVCWQAFAHSTALKLHTRRHTGERPFKCAECNAGFTQLPHWKKHMKCIHGRNEPYACKKCKSFFRIKNDLECHEKTCHPELASELDTTSTLGLTVTSPGTLPASSTMSIQTTASILPNDVIVDKATPPTSKYRVMTVERMRLLLAVLLKRISKQERLDELGFGKRLIDEVLHDSLISAGKDPAPNNGLSELEILTKNLETFLKWTVPKEHWENFRRLNKTPEDILEALTAT